MHFDNLLAARTATMGTSAIREILKVVSRPNMISLAGGIPAPESFPMDIMRDLTNAVIDQYGAGAFQYDVTEGYQPLREALRTYLVQKGIFAQAEDILIASGSQGVLDAIGKILISKGDRIAVEAPTYLGALQAYAPYEPQYVRLATDDDGLIPDSLEKVLQSGPVKFVYLVPNFQNPTGRTIPFERREAIAKILKNHNTLLIEDDPYGDLRYKGAAIPAIKTLAPEHVVYVSTLSKIFAPGLRIGFCLAPAPLDRWSVLVKQGVDLHTSTFNQALAAHYLAGGYLDDHLPKIRRLYAPKQAAMLAALDRHFPPGFRWSKPDGGMFIWVMGPMNMDMEKIYWKAIENNVAFVPGKFFFTHEEEGHETMRLNYTMADEKTIFQAIKILADVLAEEQGRL
jgi:2-aminoadipate transaminase